MASFTRSSDLIYRNIPWTGASLVNHPDFIHSFQEEELTEIDNILQKKTKQTDSLNQQISIHSPILIKKFKHIKDILQNGIGCILFKNISIDKYTLENLKGLFNVIGSYIGTPISQSNYGEKLMELKFDGDKAGTIKDRAPYNRNEAYFHTDTCDIIGLFCLNTAYSGGDSLLANSLYVHNYMICTYPDLMEYLYSLQEYHFPKWEHSDIKVAKIPIFSIKQGYLSSHYIRGRINLSENQSIRQKQKDALDTLDQVIGNKEIHLQLQLNKGDMLFFNNFLTYHGRQAFIDSVEHNKVRHFLRLWLSDSEGRPLSQELDYFYKTDDNGIRGGIKQSY